jgi:hypothetical protein
MVKNQKAFSKVLNALSLASSDARQDTLISVILNTVYEKKSIERVKLPAAITDIYGFEPYEAELNDVLESLVSEDRLMLENGSLLLSEAETTKFNQLDIELRDSEKGRFNNFSQFLISEIDSSLDNREIKFLWQAFRNYLYNSFYEFGEEAITILNPYLKAKNGSNTEDILNVSLAELKEGKLKKAFKGLIDKFPDYISENELNFLNDLAQKTISFASLGFEPGTLEDASDKGVISWILFLDTNVLYSLLNLHSHPESNACKELIKLINENSKNIDVKLRYSTITHQELLRKRGEFKHLSDNLSNSSIKGILKSEYLDDFSRQYYEGLLCRRESTIHPSQVIELSQEILKKQSIEISQDSKRIEQLGEKYLGVKTQEYLNYVTTLNESKKEAYEKKGVAEDKQVFKHKSDAQATHDITLREVIKHKRFEVIKDAEHVTFNAVKYYVVTLDDVLIKYDTRELVGQIDEKSFPVFFKPSFLLNRLVKLLPIKTENYKRAFIKAITARGFNKDIKQSHDIIRLVNYLKNLGIDNEDLVYSVISRDLFVKKFREFEDEKDSKAFVEAEINKVFDETLKELEKTKEQLETNIQEQLKMQAKAQELVEAKGVAEEKKKEVESNLKIYSDALAKLKRRIEILEKDRSDKPELKQRNIDFTEPLRKENEKLQNRLKEIEESKVGDYKNQKVKRWKRWSTFLFVGSIIISGLLIYFLPSHLDLLKLGLTILLNGISAPIFILRHFNESNIRAYRDRIRLPNNNVKSW